MEQLLALEMVRVTEAAALASARFMGRGEKDEADRAAVEAMRRTMDEIEFAGTIVIGEGERDEAPMLCIGEPVGRRTPTGVEDNPEIDIAVDPLEGTNLVAHGQAGAITVLAASEKGGLVHAPDTYLEKLCVGPGRGGQGRHPPAARRENLRRIADGARPERRRHHRRHPRAAAPRGPDRRGPRGRRPDQADQRRRPVGGDLLRRPGHRRPRGHGHRRRAGGRDHRGRAALPRRRDPGPLPLPQRRGAGPRRADGPRRRGPRLPRPRTSRSGENLVFAATGVTAGDLLEGVRFFGGGARTHSLVMAYQTKQVRFVDTVHMFDRDRPPSVRL